MYFYVKLQEKNGKKMETRCLHRQYCIYPNEWKYFFFLKTKFSVIQHAFFISEYNLLKIENSYPKQKIICYLKKKKNVVNIQ